MAPAPSDMDASLSNGLDTRRQSSSVAPAAKLSIPTGSSTLTTTSKSDTSRLRSKSPDARRLIPGTAAAGYAQDPDTTPVARVSSTDIIDDEPDPISPLTPATPATPSKHKSRPRFPSSTSSSSRWRAWARKHPAAYALYDRNRGVLLVLFAQIFGTLMNVTTRLLETSTQEYPALHPFQILFARMSITLLLSLSYMWYTQHPEFPFGRREVRWLLIARGAGGFWGVFGMYMSLRYLPLAEATVLSFLAPGLTAWVMSLIQRESFGWAERGVVGASLGGVICIARPAWLFGAAAGQPEGIDRRGFVSETIDSVLAGLIRRSEEGGKVSAEQRLLAVAFGMVGVLGATAAYTTIRLIGNRAHPLISITYFSGWSTFVSTAALILPTGVPLLLPRGMYQWGLLVFLGVNGFIMQFLLTSGLRAEKSSRSTMMVYSQMIFALAFDWGVWGVVPDAWSWVGGGIILCSAIAVAFMRDGPKVEREGVGEVGDEEEGVGLVDAEEGEDEEDDEQDEGDDVQMLELNGREHSK